MRWFVSPAFSGALSAAERVHSGAQLGLPPSALGGEATAKAVERTVVAGLAHDLGEPAVGPAQIPRVAVAGICLGAGATRCLACWRAGLFARDLADSEAA